MTWKEVLDSDFKEVVVPARGYYEAGSTVSHFEPFNQEREFIFLIDRDWNELENDGTFFVIGEQYEEYFIGTDGRLYCLADIKELPYREEYTQEELNEYYSYLEENDL